MYCVEWVWLACHFSIMSVACMLLALWVWLAALCGCGLHVISIMGVACMSLAVMGEGWGFADGWGSMIEGWVGLACD
jgi:hypothetical protein